MKGLASLLFFAGLDLVFTFAAFTLKYTDKLYILKMQDLVCESIRKSRVLNACFRCYVLTLIFGLEDKKRGVMLRYSSVVSLSLSKTCALGIVDYT